MKIRVKLEQDKGMKEPQVREAIDRAAATARNTEAQKGRGDLSHEKVREQIIKHAEMDRQKGKI